MTPEWLTLLVAVIAALGGAAMGAIITQLGAARQATIAWQRERERHEAEQVRADHYRLFDRREQAYTALYLAIGPARRALSMLSKQPDSGERREAASEARSEYWRAYARVRLIGSEAVYQSANDFLIFIDESIETQTFDRADYNDRLSVFTEAVRAELGASADRDSERPIGAGATLAARAG